MSIKTNKKFWEELILKDKKNSLEYLQNGMINLKLIPQGKPLSLFIGGKLEKQNKITNEKNYNKREIENNNNNINQNIKDESFNFDNFFNGQNMNDINELFGLDDNSQNAKVNNDLDINNNNNLNIDLDLDILDDKTNDKTYINTKK